MSQYRFGLSVLLGDPGRSFLGIRRKNDAIYILLVIINVTTHENSDGRGVLRY